MNYPAIYLFFYYIHILQHISIHSGKCRSAGQKEKQKRDGWRWVLYGGRGPSWRSTSSSSSSSSTSSIPSNLSFIDNGALFFFPPRSRLASKIKEEKETKDPSSPTDIHPKTGGERGNPGNKGSLLPISPVPLPPEIMSLSLPSSSSSPLGHHNLPSAAAAAKSPFPLPPAEDNVSSLAISPLSLPTTTPNV